MHHVFQKFVNQLSESHDDDAMRKVMADAAAAFDLQCFAYLLMPRDSKTPAALISSYPVPWTDHYLKEHYEQLDPVIALAHERTEPFEWGLGADGFQISSDQGRLFDEASAFGIRCGFTVPICDGHGPIAAVTFASDQRGRTFQQTIGHNARVLQLMSISLHAHARRKLVRDPLINGVRLSPRELECLQWVAAGKSAWEIGRILGISQNTVTFHVENAKAKLGVRTRQQAVALLATSQNNR